MAIVSDVEIRLRADIARLQQDMTRARQTISSFTTNAANLLKGFAAGFSVAKIASEVITAQREFDKLNASLVTATGSSKNAKDAMAALQKLAATTPFSIGEVTEGFLKLRNLGLTPSEKALISYGNTASAMGKSLNQMVEAVADAATGEFERLKEFGIKAKQNGDKVALTFQGTTKTIGNNAAEIEKYLMAIGDVQFAGGMERQAATLDGALSNLGDTWGQTLTAFSQSGFGDVVQGGVLSLTAALSDLGAMFKAVSGAASDEGKKVSEIGPLHKFLTTVFETITVLGANVAYIFRAIGGDIGAFAAQVGVLFRGGAKGLFDGSTVKAIQDIGRARVEEGKRERAEVDATSERILKAAEENQKAQAEEAAARAKGTKDALEQYRIKATGPKQMTDAQKKELQAYKELQAEADKQVAATARLAAGLEPLNKGQQLDADLTDDIRLKKVKLTAVQEKALRTAYAQISANDAAVESQKRYKEMQDQISEDTRKLADEHQRVIDAAEDEAKSNEMLVTTFGKTTAAIAAMEVARLKDQLAQRQGGAFTLDEIEQLEKVIALKERSAKALANVEEMEKVRDFWKDVDKTAHDTFISIADGGKDTWTRLRDTAKNVFFEWLYQQTIKKWIINVGMSADGGIGGALGSNAMSGFSNAIGLSTVKSMVSTYAPMVATAVAAYYIGGAVSGGYKVGGTGMANLINSFGVAGGLFNRAFGMKDKQYADTSNLVGSLSGGSFSGTLNTAWTQEGGWFRRNRSGVATANVDPALAASLAATYKGIQDATKQFSDVLGINADSIATRAQDLNIAFTKDEAANQKAIADFFAGVADTVAGEVLPGLSQFQQVGETAAMTLQRLATNASGVEQVLSAMNLTAQDMFGAVGAAAIGARERLLQLAGGLDAFAAQAAFYYQNFYTDAERAQALQKPVQDQLTALGFAGLSTAGDFKNAVESLVNSGKVATEEGAKQYAGLLALAPQFKQVADYLQQVKDAADALGKEKRSLNIQILELEGDAVGALAEKRKMELEQVDAGLRPLYARIYALQDEKEAADAAKEAADAAANAAAEAAAQEAAARAQALRDNESFLHQMVDSTLAAVGRAVSAEKNRVTEAFNATMAAFDASIAQVNDTISRTSALSKALKGAITAQPGETGAMREQVSRAQITAALAIAKASGVMPTPESLADALSSVTQDNADNYATLVEYQRAVARTNSELEALGGMSDDQLDTAQRQLQILQDQKAAAQQQHDATIARLDGVLAQAQAQVDAINGVNNSVLSVASAVSALQAALYGLNNGATPSNPGGSSVTVEDLYRQVLGREGDAAGVAYWKKIFGDAVDQAEYAAFVKGAQPELQGMLNAPPNVAGVSSGTMSGSSAMLLELQTMNSRLANVETYVGSTASSTGQFAQQFNQVSGGGNALAVEGT